MGWRNSVSIRLCLKSFFLILPFMAGGQQIFFPVKAPKHYICYQVSTPIRIDGKLEEADWRNSEWTDYFMDITGPAGATPYYDTQVKMLWDSQYFYIGAVLQEEHIWAKLTKRDEIIYYDNDFEIFIDPDGDNHHYMELEINALNTVWDLFLERPYRDTTHANSNFDL
ncbi:MAG: carbohydrate-binding family 9-like protein, partial [Saprospiraceae bacterium]|nr:carbohydrate-binding family 9-like protein [Saprospiraceae bacterium]